MFEVASEEGEPGLYVACFEGNCTLTNDQGTVELAGGEGGYVGGADESPKKLDMIPAFQSEDPWLQSIDEDKQKNQMLLVISEMGNFGNR